MVGLAAGAVPDLATALDPAIVSTADLQAIIDAGLEGGNTALTENVTRTLEERWSSLVPGYDTAIDTLTHRMEDGYALAATAATSDTSALDLDVVVVGEDGDLELRNRGDMP